MRRDCLPGLHESDGACYMCCQQCNYNRHICPACGDDIRHNGREYGSKREIHPCIHPCAHCGHIGHEHFDGTCRECSESNDPTLAVRHIYIPAP